VNGIRSAIRKGLAEWVEENNFDIVCIQETRAQLEQVDMTVFEDLGYQHSWFSAEKKGYSGVMTLSKQKPDLVAPGLGIEKVDLEGRILRTDFGELTLVNCYFPSASGGKRQDFKFEFLESLYTWLQRLKKERSKLILVGDFNIAHEEIDLHNPSANKYSSGFLPEERAWMTKLFENGFTDAYRFMYPETVEYSWWSHQGRIENKGWRLDYQSVTDSLKNRMLSVCHLKEAEFSDHCPVCLELDL